MDIHREGATSLYMLLQAVSLVSPGVAAVKQLAQISWPLKWPRKSTSTQQHAL